MNNEQKAQLLPSASLVQNGLLAAVWVSVDDLLPKTPLGVAFNYSNYMAVKCENELFPTTARFEQGDGWQQWYCPLTDDTVKVEFWCQLPELPLSKNSG